MITDELSRFQLSYQIAPIILVGGIASGLPNGLMSILSLLEGADSYKENESDYFAQFQILPGSNIQNWGMAEYPFASVQMAANAQIQNQLALSLLMICPARSDGVNGYQRKTQVIRSLKSQLDAHILAGGCFHVATPAYTYQNCLLVSLKDVTPASEKQVQMKYQWDFVKPLITQEEAQNTYNNLMTKFSNELPTGNPPSWSGVSTSIGNAPTSQPLP